MKIDGVHTQLEYLKPDAHDLAIRDCKIIELERENKELMTLFNHAIGALDYYARQPNGFIAQETINLIYQGGH
jgi:hypothetical protein